MVLCLFLLLLLLLPLIFLLFLLLLFLPDSAQCHFEQRCGSSDNTVHPALNDTSFPEVSLPTEVISPRILDLDTTCRCVNSFTLAAAGADSCESERRSELCG